MKKVREYLGEKFLEDPDPIQTMGIGVFHVRDFKSIEDLVKWLYDIIPIVCKVDNRMLLISTDSTHFITTDYAKMLQEYCEQYITINREKASPQYHSLRQYIIDHQRKKEHPITKKI